MRRAKEADSKRRQTSDESSRAPHIALPFLALAVLAASLGASSASAQTNQLREPRPLPSNSGNVTSNLSGRIANDRSYSEPVATHPTNNHVPQMMVRSAIYQRALDRKGNAIRLASHSDNDQSKSSSSSLRWLDPGKPGKPLHDKPSQAWQKRGEKPNGDAPRDPLADPFGEHRELPVSQSNSGVVSPMEPAYQRNAAPRPIADPIVDPTEESLPFVPIKQEAPINPAPADPPLDPNFRPFDDAPNPVQPTPAEPPAAPSSPESGLVAPPPDFGNPQAAPDQGPSSDAAPPPSAELLQDEPNGKLPEGEAEYYQIQDPTLSRNCDAERARCRLIGSTSIREITLDITPDISLESDPADRRAAEQERLAAIPTRAWSVDGEVVAEGRLVDYTQGTVIIEQSDQTVRQIPMFRLDDDDRCFVAAWWKLPLECRLDTSPAAPRNFVPMTFTWTASGICHKPLYFEERNLERYGHAAHPLIQPALSGAHFFGSMVALPYQMGIHPAYECRYDLGHYRVGSCAPWLLSPVPISLRAALLQAGVVTGGTFLIP